MEDRTPQDVYEYGQLCKQLRQAAAEIAECEKNGEEGPDFERLVDKGGLLIIQSKLQNRYNCCRALFSTTMISSNYSLLCLCPTKLAKLFWCSCQR